MFFLKHGVDTLTSPQCLSTEFHLYVQYKLQPHLDTLTSPQCLSTGFHLYVQHKLQPHLDTPTYHSVITITHNHNEVFV